MEHGRHLWGAGVIGLSQVDYDATLQGVQGGGAGPLSASMAQLHALHDVAAVGFISNGPFEIKPIEMGHVRATCKWFGQVPQCCPVRP